MFDRPAVVATERPTVVGLRVSHELTDPDGNPLGSMVDTQNRLRRALELFGWWHRYRFEVRDSFGRPVLRLRSVTSVVSDRATVSASDGTRLARLTRRGRTDGAWLVLWVGDQPVGQVRRGGVARAWVVDRTGAELARLDVDERRSGSGLRPVTVREVSVRPDVTDPVRTALFAAMLSLMPFA